MVIELPDRILEIAGLTSKEILLNAAVALYQQERLTLAQASQLAGLHQSELQTVLAEREISIHYDVEDFENDLDTIALLP